MSDVRMPRMLAKELIPNTPKLREMGRLHPIKESAELNYDSLSKVELTLPETDPQLRQHSFIEVYNINGSIGIYRVVDVTKKFRKYRTYSLNHVFDMFNDFVIQCEEVGEEISGPVGDIIGRILDHQVEKINGMKCWQLGQCDCQQTYTFENTYNNAYEELRNIAEKYPDCVFTFDFTTFPWTLNFVTKSSVIVSEMRLDRNIVNVELEETDSDQCTRLYLEIDSTDDDNVDEDDQGTEYRVFDDLEGLQNWGVIEKTGSVKTSDIGSSESDINTYIQAFFEAYRNPKLTITLTGEEFSVITGESIDRIYLGGICRTILNQYDTVFKERVVQVKYPDILRKPLYFEATFSNVRDSITDVLSAISATASSASSSSGGTSKALSSLYKEFWSDDGYFHSKLEMTAQYLRTEFWEGYGYLYSRVEQTAQYWQAEFQNMYNGLTGFVEITAEHWQSEFSDAYNGLSSRIEQTAAYWRSEIENVYSGLSSRVEQTENHWSATVQAIGSDGVIDAATICVAINDSNESEATIAARKIYLLGETIADQITANYIAGKIADLQVLNVSSLYASNSISTGGYIYADNFVIGSNTGGQGTNLYLTKAVIDVDVTNNVLKLTQADGTETTFSKATSLSGSWSGNQLTVTASPQNEHYYQNITTGSWENQDGTPYTSGNEFYIPVLAYGTGTPPSYTKVDRAYVDASSIYQAGQNSTSLALTYDTSAGKYKVYIVNHATQSMYVGYSNTQDSSTHGRTITVTVGSTTVKTDTFNDWSSGYSSGYSAGAPTGVTLGSHTGTSQIYNVSISRASGSAVSSTVNCQTPYNNGFNASHTIGIYDTNSNAVSSQTLSNGGSIDLWAGMRKTDNSFQWGSKVTISAPSFTKYYGPNGETTFTMYYMRNGSYVSAGSHNWHYR